MESNNGKIKTHKKRYVLIGISIFLVLILSISIYILVPRGKPVKVLETDELFSVIKDGDIICRLGDRLWSQLFKDISITDKRYSHMGIIRIVDNQVTVIHSEGTTEPGRDYVKEQSFADFIKIARMLGIYRLNDVDTSDVSTMAMEYVGIPFDWQFDLQDDSRIYCTQLLHLILQRIEPQIELETIFVKELGKDIIPLDAISNSEYFTEIYHITAR